MVGKPDHRIVHGNANAGYERLVWCGHIRFRIYTEDRVLYFVRNVLYPGLVHLSPGRLLKNIEKFRSSNLILGICLIVLLIVLNLLLADPSPSNAGLILAVLNALYAFASITTAFAFIGYMMAYFSSSNARMRYLSDASYWGYLIHLPVIGFFQIIVAQYEITWALKLILIFRPKYYSRDGKL